MELGRLRCSVIQSMDMQKIFFFFFINIANALITNERANITQSPFEDKSYTSGLHFQSVCPPLEPWSLARVCDDDYHCYYRCPSQGGNGVCTCQTASTLGVSYGRKRQTLLQLAWPDQEKVVDDIEDENVAWEIPDAVKLQIRNDFKIALAYAKVLNSSSDFMRVLTESFCVYDDLRHYSFSFNFERQFNRPRQWINGQTIFFPLTILASVIYVPLIFVGRHLMSRREKPFKLRLPLILWNASLAIFSAFAFVRVSNETFRILNTEGFVASVCRPSHYRDPVVYFWGMAFLYSKFFELFDTAFVVLRKKPLQFLHWYHHSTVLIFAWHTGKELASVSRLWTWMNLGVHSFMYSYYAVTAMKFNVPRLFKIFITTSQLMQMLVSLLLTQFFKRNSIGKFLATNRMKIYFFLLRFLSVIFYCFSTFFSKPT